MLNFLPTGAFDGYLRSTGFFKSGNGEICMGSGGKNLQLSSPDVNSIIKMFLFIISSIFAPDSNPLCIFT